MMDQLKIGERAVVFACVYLGSLFFMCAAMWWLMIVGGNPFDPRPGFSISEHGEVQRYFRAGEVAGIRRTVCANGKHGAEFAPGLRSAAGLRFNLPGNTSALKDGCHLYTYGFIVPALPPGAYEFASTVRYQANLVGRDEHAEFPPVSLEIIP
jgi:hypothetical protein